MDFRQATIADVSDSSYKRQHRSGKQVREFRLFSKLGDMDKEILENEKERKEAFKRAAPAEAGDEGQPKAKRARKSDGDDMLEQMMNNDKKLLVKQEANGDLDDLPDMPEWHPEEDSDEEYYRQGMAKIASGEWKDGPRKGK